MPNWKKLIVSGSDASLNSLTVNGAITAETISGSFSGSYVGDGSGLTNVNANVAEIATISDTFTSTTSKTVNHYFGTKNVIVTVYNDSDQQIIPATITTTDIDTVTVTFDSNTTGRVVVAKGGHLVSGSAVLINSTVVSSSAQISSFNTFLEIQGDNVVSGSSQIDYTLITNVPSGIVSSSAQVDYTSIQNIPLGIVSGSTQVDYTQLQNIPSGIVSGSSQVEFNSVNNNPFISSSTAVTASAHFVPGVNETYDLGSATLRWRDLYLSGSTVFLGDTKITRTQQGDVEFRDSQTDSLRRIRVDELEIGSGASARKIQVDNTGRIKFATTGDEDKTIEALGFTGIVTSSAQLSFDEIPGIPSGLVSSSIQVDLTQTTNFATGIKGRLNVEGVASGSASQIRSFLNVEDGATADQTKQDIDALNIDAATVGGFTVGKSVPSNAVFTDTTYSVQDGGLTQKNFTTELYNKLNAIEASADITDAGNVTPILNSLSVLSGSITSAKITDVDAFSQSGTYANLRAQATTKEDVGLGNVTNESKATMFTNAALTGNPTAPTQTGTDDSTKIATTAFVQGRIDAIIGTAGSTLDTLGELSASLAADQSGLASLTTTVGTKLAKASNLSDLTNVATARTNLGLGTAATTAATDYATAAQGSNADTAFGWGNHASAGYLTSLGTALVDADFSSNGLMKRTGAGTYAIVTDNSSNWNTAYGWGDHSSAGYLTAHPSITAASSVNNSGGTVIQDLTFDSNGHVTGLVSYNLDGRYFTETEINNIFNGTTAKTGYNYSNWDTAYGWGNHASAGYLTSETYTAHEDTSTLSGLYGGSNNGIVIEDITVDSNGHITAIGTRDLDGRFATTAQGSNADTAYGWGNHASAGYLTSLPSHTHDDRYYTESESDSRFLGISAKAADSNLLDGIDSTGFVKQLSDTTSPNYTTPSSRRVDPNALNPTNEHYAIVTFGNNGNVTGQLATHFVSGLPYTRGFNSSWSAWRKIWTDANDGAGSGLDADLWDGNQFSSYLDQAVLTSSTPTFAGINSSGDLLPTVDNTGVVGNPTYTWNNGHFTNLQVDSTLTVRTYIDLADSDGIRFGSSDDFRIFYDGTNNDIELEMEAACTQLIITDNATVRFSFQKSTGDFAATGDIIAYSSSDRELKDNLKPIENATDKVKKLTGYEFDWNDNQTSHQGHDIGVVAQEVEEVLPEIVTTRDNGYKAVKYEKLTALLIEAIKDQQKQIEKLTQEIKNLSK